VVVLESLSINVHVYCVCGVFKTVVVVLESLSINVPVYCFCGVSTTVVVVLTENLDVIILLY
jgi:hypothetical protein